MNEFDIEIENEIFQKVYPLDREIFMIFCKIDRYKDKMTEPLYKYMAEIHFLLFRNEMEKTTENYLMERKKERYEYLSRLDKFAPHKSKHLHIRNKAAKLIDQKVAQDWEEYLEECKKILFKVADEVKKEENPANDSALAAGVNDLSEEAAPQNDLPISTLQACDELVNYASPTPQKPQKQGQQGEDPKSDEIHKSLKTGKNQKEETE